MSIQLIPTKSEYKIFKYKNEDLNAKIKVFDNFPSDSIESVNISFPDSRLYDYSFDR